MKGFSRKVPEDPAGFIRACVRERRVLWTYHVNMRLEQRFIPRLSILDAVENYEVIESYPEDKYLPNYLVLARSGQDVFHILFGTDLEEDNVRVVTAYRPSANEWESDLKTRRSQK